MNFKPLSVMALVVLIGVVSCEEDDTLRAGGDACEDFSLNNGFGTNALLEADVQYHSPCFNPQNVNEFVYIQVDGLQGICQLRKHDLTTGQWQVLVETQFGTAKYILGPPSWGSNGWILFHTLGWDTWKVKDDGTGLTQLTFGGTSQFPVWNGAATLFHSRNPTGDFSSLIRDQTGQVVDTLLLEYKERLAGVFIPDWSLDNRMCTFKGYCDDNDGHVVHFVYGAQEVTHLWSTTNLVCSVKHIRWDCGEQPSKIYFTTDEGLYRVDAIADNTCKIMDFCTSIGYETFSISPQWGFMLATRLTTRVIDEEAWTIEFDRDIYKIDLATMLETKVILP